MSIPPWRPAAGLTIAIAALAVLSCAIPGVARANPISQPASDPGQQCRSAIRQAEREHSIPGQLLHAIARVESGRRDATGKVAPWPWTVNAEGRGRFFPTREEAIAHVRELQARGVRLIDVGCMQVNLHHHAQAFASLEEAFDPVANARYAARFLKELHGSRRDWLRAAANYHSNTPELAEAYSNRVLAAWPVEQRRAAGVVDDVVAAWSMARARRGAQALALAGANGIQSAVRSLSNGAERARIIPIGQGNGRGGTGRGLEAYRSAPIALSARPIFVVEMAEARGR